MHIENTTQVLDEAGVVEFDNLEPVRIEEPRGFEEFGEFAGDNAQGDLREFQSLDELGEAARAAGQRFKACFATS
ncbi:hypothetical protein [Candidatus Thiosymbion oneisti]|uniref:hypothetical protein n=1 Tax=Candidatus Thiosymbion oneisti TaxID=589554 RepID=UPI000B7FECFB|nr:hypothetical protein [Candidatus Thiosymbion oneisti]